MNIAVIIDLLTLVLALYCFFASFHKDRSYVIPFICGVYIIAQTGWMVSFFQGSVFGTVVNNYIWFVFNTAVFSYLTWSIHKK